MSYWLSVRRFLLGLLIGVLLGMCNLYLGLKLGFTFGTAILALFCWGGLQQFASWRTPSQSLSDGDLVCFQSLASSSSYVSGTLIATALAALMMAGNPPHTLGSAVLWASSMAGLGTCLAIPLRSRLIQRLPFPSAQVAATAVRELGQGRGTGVFFGSLVLAWCWVGLQQLWPWLLRIPLGLSRFSVQLSPMLVGLGAVLGLRTCAALLGGGLVFFGLMPQLGDDHLWAERGLWFAIAMMASASLYDLLAGFRWRKSDSYGFGAGFSRGWVAWLAVFLGLTLLGQGLAFGWHIGGLTMTGVMLVPAALVSCRVTGETDVMPTGSLAKLAILGSGAVHPQRYDLTMSGAGTVAGTATAATDAAINFKTGQLLHVPFSRQLAYQLSGALLGPVIFLPLFWLLLDGPWVLGSDDLPAPAAQIWHGVAMLVSDGAGMPPDRQLAVLAGCAAGVLFTALGRQKPLATVIPSPVPFAMAAVLDGATVLTLFLGACLARMFSSSRSFPVWCAFIAAESTAMVMILLLSS